MKLLKHKRILPIILFFILIIICLGINNYENFFTKLDGDTISEILMAKAPSMGLGVPYKDYWEYKPPGIFLILDLWIKFFSSSLVSFRILQIILFSIVGISTYLILKKIFSQAFSFIIAGLAITVLISPYLANNLLPSELFGLFFSVIALVILLYLKNPFYKFYLSALLFFLSSQMKDPFALTILAIIPPLFFLFLSKKYILFRKAVLYSFMGIISGIFLIGGYLLLLKSFNAYIDVLNIKSQVVDSQILLKLGDFLYRYMFSFSHAKNIVFYLQYQIFPILFLWILSLVLNLTLRGKLIFLPYRHKKESNLAVKTSLKFQFTTQIINMLSIIFYSLGSFIGFALGNKFDFHYMLQVILPLYFFLTIILKNTIDNLFQIFPRSIFKILLSATLIFLIFPKSIYLKSYIIIDQKPQEIIKEIYHHIFASDIRYPKDQYINSKTSPGSCILSVYGWSVGEDYYNAKRQPCTRFFLANIAFDGWQKAEYRQSLLNNPPAVIVYTTTGADINIPQFEKEVINLTKIIKNCYKKDPYNLYVPRYLNQELKDCLKQNYL